MIAQTPMSLTLKLNQPHFSPFFFLLQTGFQIKARAGSSIHDLLCQQFNVAANYFEARIQTIFIDGKPVDDPMAAKVGDGAVLALSAAMPGLVGSTFRRGGVLAAFRSDITYQAENAPSARHDHVMVKMKLFNLLVAELGPGFLAEGVWVRPVDIERFVNDHKKNLQAVVEWAENGAHKIAPEELSAVPWAQGSGLIFLKIIV